ncbi:hypothetical protein P22_0681 [Propionispora sp. 2/2-37]|uniref:isoprenylcysteine carboxyl methyltransferase family protein n=1 Tax=Propionispora sp. 2/2-37 TaxID=1677858 RepID=UPI0006BB88C3|nr:isoprenylcysteine carboxylmethyltransferase family protein [Propionispora sp. 2/2-37]CUH94615.1 hypothetical protein P22_0681 [Propionispora sp. 2/2-37]
MVNAFFWGVMLILICQRLGELILAKVNYRYMINRGAVEFGAKHYPLFILLHGAWMFCWILEVLNGKAGVSSSWGVWVTFILLAQFLRYWCIASLGRCWNTRVLILPGEPRIRRGPYRYWRHPNYLAVCIEVFCLPMLFSAWKTAAVFSVLNGLLLLYIRLPVENHALQSLKQ